MTKRISKVSCSFSPIFTLVPDRKFVGRVCSAQDVIELLRKDAQANREWLQALYLDPKNQIIKQALESFGSVDCSAVYPREIARHALITGASSVILAHNHPSGDPEPSLCDREITRDVLLALHLFQIKLLDHVIIGAKINGSQQTFSFADQGLIDDYDCLASGLPR